MLRYALDEYVVSNIHRILRQKDRRTQFILKSERKITSPSDLLKIKMTSKLRVSRQLYIRRAEMLSGQKPGLFV